MRSTNPISTPNLSPVPSRMAVPPPRFDLMDGDTPVGWIDGLSIGFRGFGDEGEAAGAASIAYRTMTRRFARQLGRRPPPIDSMPLSIDRSGEVEHILAGARPIATMLRPGIESRSGPEHFGFEMQAPVPAGELTMRATAHLVYRAVRRSGTRWAMWTPARVDVPARSRSTVEAPEAPASYAGRASTSEPSTEEDRMSMKATDGWMSARTPHTRSPHFGWRGREGGGTDIAPRRAGLPSATSFVTRVLLIGIAAVLGTLLIVAAPMTVTIPIAVVLVGGLVASGLAARRWPMGERAEPNDARGADRAGESSSTWRWGAIVALSVSFLVFALVARSPIGAVLTALGLAGLMASRVAASLTGWLPRGPAAARRI